jgi:hypothetical protein
LKLTHEFTRALSFYLIVTGYFLLRISPDFLSHGLFMDGLIYSTVAKNLSEGIGTFWNPSFTVTFLPEFHEHPPLAMGIQSIFFLILGDGRITEKLYSFITCLIVASIILKIWHNSGCKNGWIPLFFWIVTPVICWACPNNLLENTLTIFTTLSLLFFLKSMSNKRYLFLFLAGLMLSFGFLTKGFVALFPWSLPFIFWLFLIPGNFGRMCTETLIIVLSTLIPLALLILIPEAGSSLHKYIDNQVINSLMNVVTVKSRFYIVGRLASELIPAIIIVLLLLLYGYKRKDPIKTGSKNIRFGLALIVVGLTGVLPIIISQKQSGFYILPSIPFFAIGFAMLINEQSEHLLGKINSGTRPYSYLLGASCLVFLAGLFLVFFNKDKYSRDEVKLKDTYSIIQSVPASSVINIHPGMWEDWSLHGYYARLKGISLDPDLNNKREYLLIKNELLTDTTLIRNYKKADLLTSEYQLYKKD